MFFEARCDAAEVFEFAEEALDQIALAVEVSRHAALDTDAALRGEVSNASARCDPVDQGQAVIATICNDAARRQGVEQKGGDRLVGRLAGRDRQPHR